MAEKGSREDAQARYDAAYARHQEAFEDLLDARQALDEQIELEEAERRAVFMSFNPAAHPSGENREVSVEEAQEQIAARRRQKAAAQGNPTDGPIGGVA